MILSTVPGMVALGCSGIRVISRFSSAILADLAMRGLAISLLTLACVALPDSFFDSLCGMRPYWHVDISDAVPFRTVAKRSTGKEGDDAKDVLVAKISSLTSDEFGIADHLAMIQAAKVAADALPGV